MLEVACPSCGEKVVWQTSASFRPFCSERCKLMDLGAWANESYRFAAKTDAATNPSEDIGTNTDDFDE